MSLFLFMALSQAVTGQCRPEETSAGVKKSIFRRRKPGQERLWNSRPQETRGVQRAARWDPTC